MILSVNMFVLLVKHSPTWSVLNKPLAAQAYIIRIGNYFPYKVLYFRFTIRVKDETWTENHCTDQDHKPWRNVGELQFTQTISYLFDRSITKTLVCGVEFIGLHGDVKIMGIRDVSLPGERDLWRDLEFRSESVVSLSFVYVGHLTFKFSPSKTAPIAPKMHTRDKHKVNSR